MTRRYGVNRAANGLGFDARRDVNLGALGEMLFGGEGRPPGPRKFPRYSLYRDLDGSWELESEEGGARWPGDNPNAPATFTPDPPTDAVRALVEYVRAKN